MSAEVQKRLSGLFDAAEAARTCLVITDKNDLCALRRMARKEWKISTPCRGMYARQQYWDGLSPTEQTLHVMRGTAMLRLDSVFCGISAAVAYGLYVSYDAQAAIHVIGRCKTAPERRGTVPKALPARATAPGAPGVYAGKPKPLPPRPPRYCDDCITCAYGYEQCCASGLPVDEAYPINWRSPWETSRLFSTRRHQACLRALRNGTLPIRTAHGIRVTSLEQTVLDAARNLPSTEALAIADSAQRYYGLKKDAMLRYIRDHGKGLKGKAKAEWAVEHMNGLSENGGESIARATMLDCGFAEPHLQVEMPDMIEGHGTMRVDYYWMLPDGTIVVGELDGYQKLEKKEMLNGRSVERALRDERIREAHISAHGVKIMRFTYPDVFDREKFTRLLKSYGIPRSWNGMCPFYADESGYAYSTALGYDTGYW